MRKKLYLKFLLLIFILTLVFSSIVKADPLPMTPTPPNPNFWGIIITTILNYPVNLFFLILISIILLKFTRYKNIFNISARGLLLTSFLATIVGAIIDEFLVAKPLYDFGYEKYYITYSPDFNSNLILIFSALLLIFFSFFILFILLFKIDIIKSGIVGIIFILVNTSFWHLRVGGEIEYFIMSIMCIIPISICLSVVLLSLYLYKKKNTGLDSNVINKLIINNKTKYLMLIFLSIGIIIILFLSTMSFLIYQ